MHAWLHQNRVELQLFFQFKPFSPSACILQVADTGNYRIQRLGPTGSPQLVYGSRGTGQGQFQDVSESPVACSLVRTRQLS